jgi:hypothetical protein
LAARTRHPEKNSEHASSGDRAFYRTKKTLGRKSRSRERKPPNVANSPQALERL